MNNGVKYQPQLVIAGFLPSTVAPRKSKDCRLYIIYIVYIYIFVMYSTILCPNVGLGIVIDDSPKRPATLFHSDGLLNAFPQDEQKVLWMSDEASSSKRRVAWHESPQNIKKKTNCGRFCDTIAI